MTSTTDYDKCLQEMYALRRFGIKLELTTMAAILSGLGHPQKRFAGIHIAGTNGKGSIAAMLSTILTRAGCRTGRYTSPHLISFNERITINNRPISNADVVQAYQAVKDKHGQKRPPTFFEYTTAMAFYEFARQKVDLAIIETGLGGRFDATNILSPCVSIISNISLEHQMYLGHTLAAIAGEKAGIIKPKVPVVTGVRQKMALQTIATIARDQQAPLFRRGNHFKTRKHADGTFSYYGRQRSWKKLSLSLDGQHQYENAALALAACELLAESGYTITEDHLRQGLAETRWPARLEVVSRSPFILIDGAHNLAAAKSLARYLSDNLSDKKITLIIGILDDKAYQSILKTLVPLCHTVLVTQAETGRAIPPETLAKNAAALNPNTTAVSSVAEAIDRAIKPASSTDAICIAGSLYVAGEAKAVLKKKGFDVAHSEFEVDTIRPTD